MASAEQSQYDEVYMGDVGGVWKAGGVPENKKGIVAAVAGRGASTVGPGRLVLVPKGSFDASHIEHIGEFRGQNVVAEARGTTQRRAGRIIEVKLHDLACASEDWLRAIKNTPDLTDAIKGAMLDPYVISPRSQVVAAELGMRYPYEVIPEPLERIKHKGEFHRLCERTRGIDSIPGTKIAGMGFEDSLEIVGSIIETFQEVRESRHFQQAGTNRIILRKARGGGGIDNCIVEITGEDTYLAYKRLDEEGERLDGLGRLANWLEQWNQDPQLNEEGVVLAPYFEGISVSGTVRLIGEDNVVPSIVLEDLGNTGLAFQGCVVGADRAGMIPKAVEEKARIFLDRMADALRREGVQDGATIQADMRAIKINDEWHVFGAESNALRMTAPQQMIAIMAQMIEPTTTDWATTARTLVAGGRLPVFTGTDHLRIEAETAVAIREEGFAQVFRRVRLLSRGALAETLGWNENDIPPSSDGKYDLGAYIHGMIGLHAIPDRNNRDIYHIGQITATTPIRPYTGGRTVSLVEKGFMNGLKQSERMQLVDRMWTLAA